MLLPGFQKLLQFQQPSCLENPMDGGAWYAAVHGVAKSGTRLRRLSSSSSSSYFWNGSQILVGPPMTPVDPWQPDPGPDPLTTASSHMHTHYHQG